MGLKYNSTDGLDLKWRERIRHFTWTWFTMTMATGQIANVLYQVPYRFPGLYAIGCIFFILNIVLFLFNVTMISIRFKLYPATFKASIQHPTESLFMPAAVISIGTILTGISEYGFHEGKTGPWLINAMVVLFWVYCALAMTFTCGTYLILWSTQTFTISQMTPVWIFPAYPLLVIGPHAGILSAHVGGDRGLDIIIGGFALQGIGFMVSLLVYAAFLYRLMTQKLPKESLRPGMFISVGPSGFTVAGVINMARNLPNAINSNFMGVGEIAGTITLVIANWMGIWLWGLAIFFFIVSIGAHYSCVGSSRFHFAMTWFSFVFPNTGLTTATFAVGKAFDNKPIKIVGCVLTCLLIVMWFYVVTMMIRAVALKHTLWPQKQEDRDEGGWKSEAEIAWLREKEVKKKQKRRGSKATDLGADVEAGDAMMNQGLSQ
ncbi:voltage-dependent anion channel [Delphinella strobiligena]|nr:voltage-dependent anion channel [Delphinella strobiligena]